VIAHHRVEALARLGRFDAAPVGAHRDGDTLAQLARLRAALARRVLGARGARALALAARGDRDRTVASAGRAAGIRESQVPDPICGDRARHAAGEPTSLHLRPRDPRPAADSARARHARRSGSAPVLAPGTRPRVLDGRRLAQDRRTDSTPIQLARELCDAARAAAFCAGGARGRARHLPPGWLHRLMSAGGPHRDRAAWWILARPRRWTPTQSL